MTERIFNSMMKRIPTGEYSVDAYGLWALYNKICPKSYITDKIRYFDFCKMFDERKYGFEYRFNGSIRYVGTNDLNYIVVK